VANRRHPLARKRSLAWADLRFFPWVLPPVGTLLRDPVEQAFEENGLALPANAVETISASVIARYVQLSDALAVMASDVANYYADLGVMTTLALEFSRQVPPIGIVWNNERPLSQIASSRAQATGRSPRTRVTSHSSHAGRRMPMPAAT
jgi:DNA-binding transcriptional LysR family regulator